MGRLTQPPLLIATRSVHKLGEIRDLLRALPARVVGPGELGIPQHPDEDELEPFETFARNALSKALYFHGRSGIPTLADDSGLCVDALGGAPGVRTRRFAPREWAERWGEDEANNRWLLERLDGTPAGERGARYRCAIAFADDHEHHVFEGLVEGAIAEEARGTGGFGYDPLFIPAGEQATYAELPEAAKHETSHRAVALREAAVWLRRYLKPPRGAAGSTGRIPGQ